MAIMIQCRGCSNAEWKGNYLYSCPFEKEGVESKQKWSSTECNHNRERVEVNKKLKEDLRFCPFCGNIPSYSEDWVTGWRADGEGGYLWRIYCEGCNARTGYYRKKEEAAEVWNSRV